MSAFVDREAVESEGDDSMSEDEQETDHRSATPNKKRSKPLISSDEEDEEDDGEVDEEMKKFIADDDEDEASGSDQRSDSDSGHRKKKKRRRSRSDEDLDEDDMELLQENLGIKVKKQRKRIRMDSGSEDEDGDETHDQEDIPDLDKRPEGEDENMEYDSDDGGFIVDERGQPIKRDRKKKKAHIFSDSARQTAEDVFGVAFDYDEFEQYDNDEYDSENEDEEDLEEDDERKPKKRGKKRQTKSIFEIYEPRELELRHFTDQDNEIRNTDIPERMQLRATPVTAVPEGSDELEREAEWIYKNAFIKPTITKQEYMMHDDCTKWRTRHGIQEQIKLALDFIRQQYHEVPFIASYRKEYTPDLQINELWRVYHQDELWCKLQNRKRNLKQLYEKMQLYQEETIMRNPDQPLPEGTILLSSQDLERIDSIESFEELKDYDQYFKLHFGKDIQAMQDMMREKRKEERESRKLQKKEKKKKTKIITNDEGEEVEVTDDEAPSDGDEVDDAEEEEEEEMEEQETLRHAQKGDLYSLCRKFGIDGMAQKFGLTADQFSENLHDGYQKIDVDQQAADPLEVAAEYTNEKIKDASHILKAAKHMLAVQIAKHPKVRRVAREAFYERATFDVIPTKKGIKEIDESHEIYSLKYIKEKPVSTLSGDTWLSLCQAEQQKLVEIKLGHNIRSIMSNASFLDDAKELFKHDAYSKSVTEWNNHRKDIIDTAFTQMLYPMLAEELKLKMAKEAKDGVIRSCRNKLFDWIKIAKYSVNFEEEEEDDWDSSHGCRVMGIAYENDIDVASYAVTINADGEVGDFLKMEHLLKRKNSWNSREVKEKVSDMNALQDFIQKKRPHCIVISVADRMAINIQHDVQDVVKRLVDVEHFPKLSVNLMDDNLAKVYAKSQRAEQDFRDYPTILREAISIARRMQDPLIEFSQLCGPENEILCLRYHPLQDLLSEEELLGGINVEFINRVNEVGVEINECVTHGFMSNLVQFVGGLGPRKGAALLKTLRQMQSSQRLENRQQLVTHCHMGPKVLINCAGFIKIDTTSLGDSEVYLEVLDGSRIHNEAYEWARKMALDALEYEEDDANPATALEEILEYPDKLSELDLDAFAQELERQGFGKKSITLQDIRSELHHMYKDLRESFTPPNPEEVFNMVTKETPHTFFIGKLVQAVVTGFAYKKPQGEELDQAAPLRKGAENLWQCPFCGQDDFPELTEVWNHFDAGTCPGKAVGVKVRLDNGVSGFIPMKNLSDSNVLNPQERVKKNMHIWCRITKIQPERFSVECICKSSALEDKDNEWKPRKDDYFDSSAESNDTDKEKDKKQQKQSHSYMKRVIAHQWFYNINFKESEKLMAGMHQGEVIIRPSSKGSDRLTVTWKVADNINQHIDVREEGKTFAFSLGKSLWIGKEEFEDLDEIIARHINPMASHARDILSFKYYRDTDGGNRDKAKELIIEEKRSHPGKIPYLLSATKEFPGKFLLSYMPRKSVTHEYITVTPDGFRFRKQQFESLSSLMQWFKEHFRDAIPGTPVTPGRMTNRTPMGGGITPGAMSLATGTPYGNTPGFAVNTPYTPSGQTPFMTPLNTPGHNTNARGHPYRPGVTPRGGGVTPVVRHPPLPNQGMPPPPSGGFTPGRNTPGGSRAGSGKPGPYPSPGQHSGFGTRTPKSNERRTPRAMGDVTPLYDE